MVKEIVSHGENHAQDIAQYFGSQEQLQDPTQRRDYLGRLDSNDFIDLVQQTAGMVRSGDVYNQYFDGEKVSLMTHEVPDHREKEQLLRETWETARSFLSDNNLPDEDALDYAALTVAGGLLYTHPFADGNGRTSRALSYMISKGCSDPSELRGILAETNGGTMWQVAPIPFVTSRQSVFEGQQPKNIEWQDSFAGEAEDALGGDIADSMHSDIVIRRFIERYSDEVQVHLKGCSEFNDDGTTNLNGEQFIEELVNDPDRGILYASELLKLHREVRADYVQRFLESMRTNMRIKAREISPKDLVVLETDEEFEQSRKRTIIDEIGKRSVDGRLELTPAEQQLIQHRAYSTIRQNKEPTVN